MPDLRVCPERALMWLKKGNSYWSNSQRATTEQDMVPELGHFALILALAVAAVQGSLPAIGAARRGHAPLALAGPAPVVHFLLLGLASYALVYAFVVPALTVAPVVANSPPATPIL